ncbi:hypothetical protein D3C76_868730 [compost metagenome]
MSLGTLLILHELRSFEQQFAQHGVTQCRQRAVLHGEDPDLIDQDGFFLVIVGRGVGHQRLSDLQIGQQVSKRLDRGFAVFQMFQSTGLEHLLDPHHGWKVDFLGDLDQRVDAVSRLVEVVERDLTVQTGVAVAQVVRLDEVVLPGLLTIFRLGDVLVGLVRAFWIEQRSDTPFFHETLHQRDHFLEERISDDVRVPEHRFQTLFAFDHQMANTRHEPCTLRAVVMLHDFTDVVRIGCLGNLLDGLDVEVHQLLALLGGEDRTGAWGQFRLRSHLQLVERFVVLESFSNLRHGNFL